MQATKPSGPPARGIPVDTLARLLDQALQRLERDQSRPPLFYGTQACALAGQAMKLAAQDFDHALGKPFVDAALAFSDRGLRETLAGGEGRPPGADADVQALNDLLGRAQCWHARAMVKALVANASIELPFL